MILSRFWEGLDLPKIEKIAKILFFCVANLKEGSGRVLGEVWDGFGKIFEGFWRDFGWILERFCDDFFLVFRFWREHASVKHFRLKD